MKQTRFLLPAEQELTEAAVYYESQAIDLGKDFLKKVKTAVADILDTPKAWPSIRFSIRRRLIHRFPYAILYKIDKTEVIVIAVMHLRRQPNYWLSRVK